MMKATVLAIFCPCVSFNMTTTGSLLRAIYLRSSSRVLTMSTRAKKTGKTCVFTGCTIAVMYASVSDDDLKDLIGSYNSDTASKKKTKFVISKSYVSLI